MTPGSETLTKRLRHALSGIAQHLARRRAAEHFHREVAILRGAIEHATTERSDTDLARIERRVRDLAERVRAVPGAIRTDRHAPAEARGRGGGSSR